MRKGKRRAGVGETLTVNFLGRDQQEEKALLMSQRLAMFGRRSLYLITMLSALYDVCDDNGALPEMVEVTNAIHDLRKPKNGGGK